MDELFASSWQELSPCLYRSCLRWMGGNPADADEALSRTGFAVYTRLAQHYQSPTDLQAWALRIAHNACMDLHREKKRRPEVTLDPDFIPSPNGDAGVMLAPFANPERRLLENELARVLRRSIEDLPQRLRVTMLTHLSSANHREAGRRLRISEANMRKRLEKARKILGSELRRYQSGQLRSLGPPPATVASNLPPACGEECLGWRTYALRPVSLRLASGIEADGVVELGQPPKKSSKRREHALESYVRRHPSGWKRRLALGCHLRQRGLLDEAIQHFEHVVERHPFELAPWYELVSLYRLQERFEEAAATCRRALARVPGNAAGHFLRGLLGVCQGSHGEAEGAFRAAHEADPRSAAPMATLAEMHRSAGRLVEAVDALDAALRADLDDVAALTFGHDALRLAGRAAEAHRRVARALELDPANPLAMVSWLEARCRATGGRFEPHGAEHRCLAKVRELAETHIVARRAVAFWHLCRGELELAERQLAELVRERPCHRDAWAAYAELLDWLGKKASAVEAIDKACGFEPIPRELALQRCRLLARTQLVERAKREGDALLERWGEIWEVASTAAWVLAVLGEAEQRVLPLSQVAVSSQPLLPIAWLEHGRLLAHWDRLAEAADALEHGWSLLPTYDGLELAVPAAIDLVLVHRRLSGREFARQWMRRAVAHVALLKAQDPTRARIWKAEHRAVFGDPLPTVEVLESDLDGERLEAVAESFREVEERRLFGSQLVEVVKA